MPPPGAGLVTVMGNEPALATSAAVIAAVTCVAVTNVVVRAEPLKFTVEVLTKFVPLTVRVNPASPAVLVVGEMLVVVGTRLLTVNVCALEVPPPGAGFVTVMLNVPAVVKSLAGMEAVTWVALTKLVVRGEPLKFTTEFVTKLVPFTVSVKSRITDVLAGGRNARGRRDRIVDGQRSRRSRCAGVEIRSRSRIVGRVDAVSSRDHAA